jgi:uncharacterized Zn finger protein
MSWYGGWRPYVPVAQRRARAAVQAAKLAKKEKRELAPVQIAGRAIAHSFWGQAWCENLERYSDFANRLPRGRTYARNGSIVDLQIKTGKIEALVSGSELYRVRIAIRTLPPAIWKRIKQDCAQSIDSLIDLLQGRFSEGVMGRLTQPQDGLFPRPGEIDIRCSCPDFATLCKHAAAVLYGVGARLDTAPEMLFTLRHVDHFELVCQAADAASLDRTLAAGSAGTLAGADLGEVFGIDLAADSADLAQDAESGPGTSAEPAPVAPSARVHGSAPRRGRPGGSKTARKAGARAKVEKRVPARHSTKTRPASAKHRRQAGKRAGRKARPLSAVSA